MKVVWALTAQMWGSLALLLHRQLEQPDLVQQMPGTSAYRTLAF
jgi:hypothetical protein